MPNLSGPPIQQPIATDGWTNQVWSRWFLDLWRYVTSTEGIRFASRFPGADIGAQINAAIADLGGSGTVFVAAGSHTLSTTVTVSYPGVHIVGAGDRSTIINVASGTAFSLTAGASVLYNTSIQGMRLEGSGSSLKTGIILSDVSECLIENVTIHGFSGSSSIGIQTKGRELVRLKKVSIQADTPIDIQANPNSALMADAFDFSDLYLLTTVSTNPAINVAAVPAGAIVQHWRMNGVDAIGGKYMVYWNDSTNPFAALDISWNDLHWEQAGDITGYGIYVDKNVNLIKLDMIDAGSDANGFYFRHCNWLTLQNTSFQRVGGVGLDVDSTVIHLVLSNAFFQTSETINLAGQNLLWSGSSYAASTPSNAAYESTAGAASGQNVLNAVNLATTGTIVNSNPSSSAAVNGLDIKSGSTSLFSVAQDGSVLASGGAQTITARGEVRGGGGGNGSASLIVGSAGTTGYVQWLLGNGTRLAYAGTGSTDLDFHAENGAKFNFIGGPVATARTGVTLANGANSDIVITGSSFVKIAGPTGVFSISGFAGGSDGRILRVYNSVAFAMTITNNATSTAANRILTLTGADVTLRAGQSFATFIYDSAQSLWILTGTN